MGGVRNPAWCLGLVCLIAHAAGCDESGGSCSQSAVEAALRGATAGDVVHVGRCRIELAVNVGPGVSLVGDGAESVLVANGDAIAVTLEGTTSAPAILRGLTVQASGKIGVFVRGGSASLQDVVVETARGVAVAARGTSALTLERVSLRGPIDPAHADDPELVEVVSAPPVTTTCEVARCDCIPGAVDDAGRVCTTRGTWATVTAGHGLVLVDATATLREVEVRGFAAIGAAFEGSTVTWSGGAVSETLGVGVSVVGGTLEADSLTVSGTLQGVRGTPPVALIASDGANLRTRALVLRDNDRYGLVQAGSRGEHTALRAEANGDAAVWLDDVAHFVLDGTLQDNAFAGVVASASHDVQLRNLLIAGTRTVPRPLGAFGTFEVGDGVHLVHGPAARLENVELRDNGRAGVLLDLTDAATAVTFTGVRASASGAALGAIAGQVTGGVLVPVASGPWDMGIERLGAAATNDAAFRGTLQIVPTESAVHIPGREQVGLIIPML